MKADGTTVNEILANIPIERKEAFQKMHETIVDNLPKQPEK